MSTFRTDQTLQKYREVIATGAIKKSCPLCAAPPIQTFSFWKIINNDFPYDKIAKKHHMLVPLQHVTESKLSKEALDELLQLKVGSLLNQEYNYLLEATSRAKSISEHFHIHLIETIE